MPEPHPSLVHEEYRALRATIRERGTVRVVIATFIFVAWATLSIAVQAFVATPTAALIPLVVLVAGFEIVLSLQIGVERIGRYLQIHFEGDQPGSPAWETVIMRVGPPAGTPALGLDALFSGLFLVATVLNLLPAAIQSFDMGSSYLGLPVELVVLALIHALFIVRVFQGRRFAARQRQSDLDLFARDRAARG